MVLLVALTGCSGPSPPSDGAESPPGSSPTEPAGPPPTRLYLAESESGPGTGDGTYDLVAEPSAATRRLGISSPTDDFAELVRWQVEVGDAVTGVELRTSVHVTSAARNVEFRWRLQRVDECGVVAESSEYTSRRREVGVHTAALELETDWLPGDRLRMSYEARTVNDEHPGLVEIAVGHPDSHVEATIAGGTVPDAAGSSHAATPRPETIPSARLRNTLPVRDAIVGSDTTGLTTGEFRWNNQRNFWWNSARGRWDGILPTASPPASEPSHWWLWTDLGGDPTPVMEISTRTANTPDIYWHEECELLYVFLSRDASGTSRFRRFAYVSELDRYIEDSARGGVAAPTTLRGSKRVSIVLSPKGHLWAAVNHEGRLLVSRSTDRGDTWPEPVEIAATAANGDTHWVVFAEDGAVRVGVAATEDGAAEGARIRFLSLDQSEPAWDDPASWIDETASIPGPEGDERADDELSAIAYDDVVYITGETEPVGSARDSGAPQLVVYRRTPGGAWSKHVAARYTSDGAEDRKRPVVTVNEETGHLLLGAGRNNRGLATLFRAPLADLGTWEEHVIFRVVDAGETLYNVRLPRTPVDETMGTLALVERSGAFGEVSRQLVLTPRPACGPTVAVNCGS